MKMICTDLFNLDDVIAGFEITTMASFKLQFSLSFVTSCYVIMNISIA